MHFCWSLHMLKIICLRRSIFLQKSRNLTSATQPDIISWGFGIKSVKLRLFVILYVKKNNLNSLFVSASYLWNQLWLWYFCWLRFEPNCTQSWFHTSSNYFRPEAPGRVLREGRRCSGLENGIERCWSKPTWLKPCFRGTGELPLVDL